LMRLNQIDARTSWSSLTDDPQESVTNRVTNAWLELSSNSGRPNPRA